MRFINQSVTLIENNDYTLQGVYKAIEKAARTCYKSEDLIKEDSATSFVEKLIASKHYAMLEHGIIYLTILKEDVTPISFSTFKENKYSKLKIDENDNLYITTNYRVILENHLEYYLKYITAPTIHHQHVYSFKIITNRAIANELVRHRVFSFAQESTRFCNYSKDRFGKELTFIRPNWLKSKDYFFIEALKQYQFAYLNLIYDSHSPQEARDILPLALKTELIMTGYQCDWKDFVEKRTVSNAHPQAIEIANKINEYLK